MSTYFTIFSDIVESFWSKSIEERVVSASLLVSWIIFSFEGKKSTSDWCGLGVVEWKVVYFSFKKFLGCFWLFYNFYISRKIEKSWISIIEGVFIISDVINWIVSKLLSKDCEGFEKKNDYSLLSASISGFNYNCWFCNLVIIFITR